MLVSWNGIEMGLKWDPEYGCVYDCVIEMGFKIDDAFMIVFVQLRSGCDVDVIMDNLLKCDWSRFELWLRS